MQCCVAYSSFCRVRFEEFWHKKLNMKSANQLRRGLSGVCGDGIIPGHGKTRIFMRGRCANYIMYDLLASLPITQPVMVLLTISWCRDRGHVSYYVGHLSGPRHCHHQRGTALPACEWVLAFVASPLHVLLIFIPSTFHCFALLLQFSLSLASKTQFSHVS